MTLELFWGCSEIWEMAIELNKEHFMRSFSWFYRRGSFDCCVLFVCANKSASKILNLLSFCIWQSVGRRSFRVMMALDTICVPVRRFAAAKFTPPTRTHHHCSLSSFYCACFSHKDHKKDKLLAYTDRPSFQPSTWLQRNLCISCWPCAHTKSLDFNPVAPDHPRVPLPYKILLNSTLPKRKKLMS